MKFKRRVDIETGLPTFLVELDKGTELDYTETATVRAGIPPFARCKRHTKGSTISLSYALGRNDVPLEKRLNYSVDLPQLSRMLADFLDVVVSCELNSLSLQRVVFDPARIFCDSDTGALSFLYLPTRAFVDVDHDIRSSLLFLCRKTKPLHRSDGALLEQIEDYILRSAMFTSVDYRSMLQRLGILENSEKNYAMHAGGAPLGTATLPLVDSRTSSFGFDFVQEQAAQQQQQQQTVHSSVPPAQPVTFTLVRESTGSSWKLTEGLHTLGRAEGCSIVLTDVEGVSRVHATFKVADGMLMVCDEDSTNGVRINGSRISPRIDLALQPHDVLTIGTEKLIVR